MVLGAVGCLAAVGLIAANHYGSTGAAPQASAPPQGSGPSQEKEKPQAPAVPAAGAPAPAENPPPAATAEGLQEEALAVVRQLMADFPRSSDPLGLMGTLYRRMGNNEEAEKWWAKCLDRNPRRADAYLGMAKVAAERGENEKAVGLWRKALEINPRLPGLHSGYASTLLEMGSPAEAIAVLEKGITVSPGDGACHMLLGQAYLQQREYEKAVKSFERALEIQPDDSKALFGLGNTYARQGRADKAEEAMEKFKAVRVEEDEDSIQRRRIASDRVWAARVLAATLTDAALMYGGSGRLKTAEEYWRKARALDPKNRTCRERLVDVCRSTGRLPEAVSLCEELRAMAPREALYHLNAGALRVELQQYDAAEEAMRKAIEIAPKFAASYRSLAQLLLFRDRQLPEAKALAEQLVALEPSALNFGLLGEARRRNGDLPGARAALERALAIDPGNEKLKGAYREVQ